MAFSLCVITEMEVWRFIWLRCFNTIIEFQSHCLFQLRLFANWDGKTAVIVRDDYPQGQLEFEMKVSTGPQVVMDGSRTYTVHFPTTIPKWVKLTAPGLDQ